MKSHLKRSLLPKSWQKSLTIMALLVLLIAAPGTYLLLRHPPNAQAAWFDTNWAFRTRYPLTNTSGATQTSFQTQITVNTATLVSAGKLQSNCQDVRFTNISGKQLPFWIEPNTCNTTTTLIWVNVDSIPTSAAPIFIFTMAMPQPALLRIPLIKSLFGT